MRDFEAMKGIDYITETNTYRAFYLSKSLTCVLSPVWGYRGKDIHSSEEKLGPGNPHVAKVAPLICCVASVVALMV